MGIGRGMSRGLRDAERRPGVGRYVVRSARVTALASPAGSNFESDKNQE